MDIDVEQYGNVTAHIKHFASVEAVELLDRLRILPDLPTDALLDSWTEAADHWRREIVEEARCEKRTISDSFAKAFAATQARLRAEKPAVESLGPRRELKRAPNPPDLESPTTAPETENPAFTSPEAPAVVEKARPIEVPSFLLAERQSASLAQSGEAVPGELIAQPLSWRPEEVGGSKSAMSSSASINETMEIRTISEAPVLPFTDKPTAESSTKIVMPAERRPPATRDPRDETAFLPAILDLKPSLPFRSLGARGEIQRVKIISSDGAGQAPPEESHQRMLDPRLETGMLPSSTGERIKLGAPRPSEADGAPRLTLEQYASLCAELAVHPERRAEVLTRYGVDSEAAMNLEEQRWVMRMQANGPQLTHFGQLVASFRDHLERIRGR